jgi:hypothetical protein
MSRCGASPFDVRFDGFGILPFVLEVEDGPVLSEE